MKYKITWINIYMEKNMTDLPRLNMDISGGVNDKDDKGQDMGGVSGIEVEVDQGQFIVSVAIIEKE